MQYVDIKINETLQIGDATVTLVRKSGQLARLSIIAGKEILVKKIDNVISLPVRQQNDIINL